MLIRQERVIRELDFMSLADILASRDLSLKRGAVEKLYQLKTPAALKLLMKYRNDPHPDVRFYVTSTLDRVKHDYEMEMKKDMTTDRLVLAKKYIEYIQSGLLDEGLEQKYFEDVVVQLKTILQSDPVPEEAWWLLIEQYRFRSVSKYRKELLELIAAFEKSGGHDLLKLKRTKAEILFLLGEYREMLQVLKMEPQDTDPEWKALLFWWGVVT